MIHMTHNCDRQHRSYASVAECLWPEAGWIVGSGPHAVLAHCDMLSVNLYETAEKARVHLDRLEQDGCGQTCTGHHEDHVLAVDLGTRRRRRLLSGRSSTVAAR